MLGRMTQTERACLTGAVVGAAVGAAVAFFYATDEGARRRRDLMHAVERVTFDVDETQQMWARLRDVWSQYQRESVVRPSPVRLEDARGWPPGVA